MKTLFYAVVALLCLIFTAPVKGNLLPYIATSEVRADDGGGIVTIVQGRTLVVIYGDIEGKCDIKITPVNGEVLYESEATFPIRKSLSIKGWKTGAYIVVVKQGSEVHTSRFEIL